MRKNSTKTLAHLLGAMDAQRAITIRYVKEDGTVSRRMIEIHQIEVTSKGNLIVKAWDRRDAEMTSFRLDRITHYTLHRANTDRARYAEPVAPVATATALVDEDAEVIGYVAWAPYELAA